ncbi:MAG: hypothetical protein EPO51_20230 [Phenylobacterium sp.]|uniref:hypothetical protein n=1 Tax=Phenylobacterium sp. TaxID=1871053 RepID=UPI001209384B|nr:hypothetical protein [Phenylobacterium sp.]TAJ69858.1 MAG: hypothetical protein EPO51_20230 [Phenylobacterium sp.]
MNRLLNMAALALGFASLPGPASAKAFDLQCEHARYRVDPTRKLWCEEPCTTLGHLQHRPGEDVLTLSYLGHFEIAYDRRTGMVTRGFGGLHDGGYLLTEPCRVRRFSGFPRRTRLGQDGRAVAPTVD